MNRTKYIFRLFALCLFIYGCRTVNNYYTVVEDSSAHNKKLLAGTWLLTNCSGYDSSSDNGPDQNTIFSYDSASRIISVANNVDTSITPLSIDHYFVDSMALNIDSSGYYTIREAYSKNGSTTLIDSLANTWTYIWTNDSSSILLLNPMGVEGDIFGLIAGGYASSSGNLIVRSLDSTRMVLGVKGGYGREYGTVTQYERFDVRYTLKKR